MPGVPMAEGSRHHDPHPCLAVVIPCYNEVATVRAVVDQVLASPWTAEVIVVDDGSTDGTRDVLAGIDHPQVRVLLQAHNQGKGAALRRGFGAATADYVVVQDADLEYDPAEYGTLMEPLVDGLADVVFGSRFISSRPHRVLYFWHSVGNRFLTTLSNMFTNLNLTDMETCYKVFRREVIQSVAIEEDRFGFEPEVTAKVAQAGWRVYEVGISYNGRTYAEGKKIGWRDGVRAVWCIAKYSAPGERLLRSSPAGRLSTGGPQPPTDATPGVAAEANGASDPAGAAGGVDGAAAAGDADSAAGGVNGAERAAADAGGGDGAAGDGERSAGAPHSAG